VKREKYENMLKRPIKTVKFEKYKAKAKVKAEAEAEVKNSLPYALCVLLLTTHDSHAN
jgi:hypothetical protein